MRFSIGTDDFKRIRTEKSSEGQLCFYCDKSLLIKDIIDDGSSVFVFPRPKRFGKTLNMSMLKYFFDIEQPGTAELFTGLQIAEHKNIMEEWQGKYPVVSISFKSLRSKTFEQFKTDLKVAIFECYQSYTYLKTSPKLKQEEKDKIQMYFEKDFDDSGFTYSLKYLTEMLKKHHDKYVVVLIDEYDMPLQEAYLHGFFEEAIEPFRNMLGEVLKGNEYLYKGIVTGITRIAKESLFSGVNNLDVYDITRNKYAEYFGFTEEEIKVICDAKHLADLKSWYNGYMFGDDLTIYNPWSILNFLSNDYKLAPYWINTSSNELIKDNLTADKLENVKALINGESINIEIEPFTVMDNLRGNNTAFWNLLFMSGFLTLDADKKMRIPNQEILYFFNKVVLEWFNRDSGTEFLQEFLASLLDGDNESVQNALSKIVGEVFSFQDGTKRNQESFYHGIVLGITLGLKGKYKVKSNRESGYGLYDIALFPENPAKDAGIVIEIKTRETAEQALAQIQRKAYSMELKENGCRTIHLYGIRFKGKEVTTQLVTERI